MTRLTCNRIGAARLIVGALLIAGPITLASSQALSYPAAITFSYASGSICSGSLPDQPNCSASSGCGILAISCTWNSPSVLRIESRSRAVATASSSGSTRWCCRRMSEVDGDCIASLPRPGQQVADTPPQATNAGAWGT